MTEIRAHATPATPRMQLAACVLLLRAYKAASDALYRSEPGSAAQANLLSDAIGLRARWEAARATLSEEAQARVIEQVMNCTPPSHQGQETFRVWRR